MAHKNDYSVVVFFEGTPPKKWNYVHNLRGFAKFLDTQHSTWSYMNVYNRREAKFLKRFVKHSDIPDFL